MRAPVPARNPIRAAIDLNGRLLTTTGRTAQNQSQCVDKHAHQEVPLQLHLRINLVRLEDTEPRVAPSNGWKSCLRPPPPGWGFHDGAAVKPLGCWQRSALPVSLPASSFYDPLAEPSSWAPRSRAMRAVTSFERQARIRLRLASIRAGSSRPGTICFVRAKAIREVLVSGPIS